MEKIYKLSRSITITRCCDCPYLSRCTWHCTKLQKKVPSMGNPIPDWCPLPIATELCNTCCPTMDKFCKQYMIGYQGVHDVNGKIIKFRFCPYCGTSITTNINNVVPRHLFKNTNKK